MASGSGSGKAKASSWAAAMSVGTVETLKDQAALCRWNHAFRSVQQRTSRAAAGNGASCGKSGARALPSSGGAPAAARRKAKQQEEELRTVMYLSNWGPNN